MGQNDSWDYLANFIKKNIDNFEEELAKAPYAVKIRRHETRPNLVMFKYSQFESDFTNPVVRCCRGSVYDISEVGGDWTVKPYLMPFFKFNNYGENGADPIDWKGTLYVRDKLDGSLLKLLKEPGGNDLWTTNRSFDLSVDVPELFPAETDEQLPPPYTFAALRDYSLRGHEEEIRNLPEGWTFMFELISPYNRIIVPYRKTKLVFLACRDGQGVERNPEWAAETFGMTFETPKVYPFKSIDEVIAYCKSLDSNDREGVVVQDGNFNRVKIKSDHYRSLFLLKGDDHFSSERIFDAIKQESIDDALAAWPEIRPKVEEIIAEWIGFRNAMTRLCEKAVGFYQECRRDCDASTVEGQKEAKKRYAMFVLEKYKNLSSFLFEAVKEKVDLETLFNKIGYKEFKNYWIPSMESIESIDSIEDSIENAK